MDGAADPSPPRVAVAGIVPSKVGRRTLHRDDVLDELAKRWPGLLLTGLPDRRVFQDATVNGQPVTTYAPHGPAADAVRTLTQEVLTRVVPT